MGCTINEPNVVSLIGYRLGAFPPGVNDRAAYDRVNENLKARAPQRPTTRSSPAPATSRSG